jgi:hypothetical protein
MCPMRNKFWNLNLIDSRYGSMDGRQARRKAANNTGQKKHRINADVDDILKLI